MKGFWSIFDKVVDAMAILAGGLLLFITAAVCYSIGLRYLFTRTTLWLAQTTEYALLWIVFLATTWLLKEGGHITTDILHAHLKEKTRHRLDGFMFVVGGAVCALLFYLGWVYTWDCIENGVTDVRAITVPKWSVFIIIPIGSLLLTFQFFRMAWNTFVEIRRNR